MSHIHVIGHKIPDTDSILSAILFANYLQNKGIDAKAYKLGEINNETKFILNRLGISVPETIQSIDLGSKVALVDHNEKSQSFENSNELVIEYIIDHHKIGNLSTPDPIFIRIEKLCCTSSIIYKMFRESDFTISKQNATLMISAILSDSLHFRSPTTTEEDKKILEELNKIAEIEDLEEFSMEMFKAKSDLGDISAEELIKIDYKEFDMNSRKVGVGTVETTNPDYSLNRKKEIVEKMQKIKNESGLDMIILSIVDILNEKNITIVSDEHDEKILKDIFGIDTDANLADLGARLSRKKQIIPDLTDYYNKL